MLEEIYWKLRGRERDDGTLRVLLIDADAYLAQSTNLLEPAHRALLRRYVESLQCDSEASSRMDKSKASELGEGEPTPPTTINTSVLS